MDTASHPFGISTTTNALSGASAARGDPRPGDPEEPFSVDGLIALAVGGLTSEHSKRSYRTGLVRFIEWYQLYGRQSGFCKELVNRYRDSLIADQLSPSTINLRLAPVRKLAREMTDAGLLAADAAAAIGRAPGVPSRGTRLGNWLVKDQANYLLNSPDPHTLVGKRDRAILAVLIGCGLRRAELLDMSVEMLQQREGRWVLPDMAGKGGTRRTVTIPPGVKARVDQWLVAAGITKGRVFRPINKAGRVTGLTINDEKMVWRLVVKYAKLTSLAKLAPHDLRRTCAKLCRKAGGDLEQIQILLGHASVQTTERYLGTEQALTHAVNDAIGLDL